MSTAIETKTRRRDLVFGIAFITRILLFQFSEITNVLASRVEVVTPVTSFTRLTEGLYLFQNGVPPYDGGVFHQAPLLLAFFQPLSYLPDQFTSLTYILVDLLLGYLLSQISRTKEQLYKDLPRVDDIELIDDNKSEGENEEPSWVVAGLYLFNPLTIATCLSKSTITFTNLAIALGTFYSLKGGIMAVFKSYPSIGDASFYLGFLPIYSEIVKYMRYNFFTTNIFLYSSVLAPIFYHLWIYAGSGNANFFYAITLVYSVGNIILLVDATFAMLRREFDVWNPKLRYSEVMQR
ncbi:8685_t:CDS:2 [Ambispora gerdemannii]|uniref:8685_t:CDS:1 n=1 Tax=Ambispora gerdemannii TaxID=144530 RepID=A0A9N8ZNC2_9GLOM|nr:8685_t:CDS:2 [Ambispora gerdemannii]